MLVRHWEQKHRTLSNILSSIDARYIYYLFVAIQYFAISLAASNGTIYSLKHGITNAWVGYLGVISSLTIIFFEFPTGIVADRFGRSISITISLVLRGLAALFTIVCFGPLMFAMVTFVSAIGFTFISGASEAWAFSKDKSIKDNIAEFFAYSAIVNGAARILGGGAGGVIASLNPDIPFFLSGTLLIGTAAIFIAYDYLSATDRPVREKDTNSKKWSIFKSDVQKTIKIVTSDKTLFLISIYYSQRDLASQNFPIGIKPENKKSALIRGAQYTVIFGLIFYFFPLNENDFE